MRHKGTKRQRHKGKNPPDPPLLKGGSEERINSVPPAEGEARQGRLCLCASVPKGFTLVEGLLVLAIIGILATMVATRMSRDIVSEEDAKQAAYLVAQSMNFARSNAFSHSSENTKGYSVKFYDASSGEAAPYVKGSVVDLYTNTTDPYDVKIPSGVVCSPVDAGDAAQRFDFLPDGTAKVYQNDDATEVGAGNEGLVFSFGAKAYTVTVTKNTGRVRVEEP